MLPSFKYEDKLQRKGYKVIAGVDEVGRGSFAGPVVCGIVVFKDSGVKKILKKNGIKINDSKKLTKKQRELASNWIKKNAYGWGVGVVNAKEVDRLGLSKATASGIRRSIASINIKLDTRVEYLLIDAFYAPYIKNLPIPIKKKRGGIKGKRKAKIEDNNARQLAIVNGDEKSISIAGASIIAKVYRDKLMTKLAKYKRYKKYQWDKNSGYGTKLHREMIRKYGITRHHRKKYCLPYI